MPVNAYTELGSNDDAVSLRVDGEVTKYSKYSITRGIMSQPSVASITFGSGDLAKDIIKKFQPGKRFELRVGPTIVQSGILEDITGGANGGATEITIAGRDWIAPLTKRYIRNEVDFGTPTYFDLVRRVLDICGLKDRKLTGDNTANRRKSTRSVVAKAEPAGDVVETMETGQRVNSQVKIQYQRITAKLGQTWWDFLRSQLKKIGLYLWATPTGDFILARPTAKQRPLYLLRHGRNLSRTETNILSMPYQNRCSSRHARALVLGRTGAGPKGLQHIQGEWEDFEMLTLGFEDEIVVHDKDCQTPKECEYLAIRTLAEERRANCALTATVSGHTTPSLLDSGQMVIWAPDTCVSLYSEEYGIDDDYYIEEVTFNRQPQTTTTLKLMRKVDLIYLGESDATEKMTAIDATQARSVDLRIGSAG